MDRRFQADQGPDTFCGLQLVPLLEVACEHALETDLMGLVWRLVHAGGDKFAGAWA